MKLKCLKCGYEWISRLEGRPKACPECKNRKWDVAKEEKKEGGKKIEEVNYEENTS